MTEEEFRADCTNGGWGEPRVVDYAPDQRPDMHAHPFDAFVLMTDGEMILALADDEVRLAAGETVEVPAGTEHAENGGPSGGRALVATRDRAA